MEGYGHLLDDDDQTANVGAELSQIAFDAGYGRALLDVEHANSSDAAGDRIVAAADRLSMRELWDTPPQEREQ